MYAAHLGPGDTMDFVEPSVDGPIIGYSHAAIASRFNEMKNDDIPDGYRDGMNMYEYCQSTPTSRVDPLGLQAWQPNNPFGKPGNNDFGPKLSEEAWCGNLLIKCKSGDYKVSVHPNSRMAWLLNFGNGCISTPRGIYCSGSCEEIKTWVSGDNPKRKILDHEACHMCALKDEGTCAYLGTWGPSPDACVGNEKESKPLW